MSSGPPRRAVVIWSHRQCGRRQVLRATAVRGVALVGIAWVNGLLSGLAGRAAAMIEGWWGMADPPISSARDSGRAVGVPGFDGVLVETSGISRDLSSR